MKDYLEGFWADLVPGLMDLFDSLHVTLTTKTKGTSHSSVSVYVSYIAFCMI